jgi:hypothetical protein
MVKNPSNVELIRWSEAGDSFFGAHHLHFISMNRSSTIPITVLDHERFTHEDGSSIITSAPLYANSTVWFPQESSLAKATTKRNFGILTKTIHDNRRSVAKKED